MEHRLKQEMNRAVRTDLVHAEKLNQTAGMEPAFWRKLPEAVPSAAGARRVADLSYPGPNPTSATTVPADEIVPLGYKPPRLSRLRKWHPHTQCSLFLRFNPSCLGKALWLWHGKIRRQRLGRRSSRRGSHREPAPADDPWLDAAPPSRRCHIILWI